MPADNVEQGVHSPKQDSAFAAPSVVVASRFWEDHHDEYLDWGSAFAIALLTNHSPSGVRVIDAALQAVGLAAEEPQPIEEVPLTDYSGVFETVVGRVTLTPLESAYL